MVTLPFPLIAFGFGILSVLSPCILPFVPLIAAYSTRTSKITPLTVAIGLSISFALIWVYWHLSLARYSSDINWCC